MGQPILTYMQARYLGDALPFEAGSPVEVDADASTVTITHAGHAVTLARDQLTARVEKRLTFDPSRRRTGPSLFGRLSIAERRGEPVLMDVARVDTPQGPVILAMEDAQAFVKTFTMLRHVTTASVDSIRDRPLRRLIAIAILVLVALIIAVISARPNLH
ncbi:MAG TPA: hypothetical protein VET82_04390 [Candidatus Eisenbacteria bacterium]|nr:hypothetical protein [Candidatus Eisenbacteria bacterium]